MTFFACFLLNIIIMVFFGNSLIQGYLLKPNYNRVVTSMDSYPRDRSDFYTFYEETVPFGSEMSLNQFLTHPYVEDQLLLSIKKKSSGGLTLDRISDIWIDLWSCNCMCISEEKAYQTLCALFNDIEINGSV
jgi:hypothetical protein